MAKKRERLDVIHDILVAVREKQRIGPTRLLYASNLSPQMFREYTEELLGKGLLVEEQEGKKKVYALSEKGYEFLARFHVITDFIKNFGL